MGPSLTVEGASTSRVFETYVEKVVVPNLCKGQIVVMDNLGAHRPKRIRQLIGQRGCELFYLPAYSPDYSTRSKKRLPRSKTYFARPRLGAKRLW
jgi:transposase